MELPRPFIRLPFAFDAERMAEEVHALPDSAWMSHPSRLRGNSAVALISRDGSDNDHFDGAMAPTPHLKASEYIGQAMASFGEVLGRSRLMRLAAGAEVAMHVDFNYHWCSRVRIHIPVITDPAVIFYCADAQVHMQAGECWIFNSWRRHRVCNESMQDRVHLVIDLAGSSRFWQVVRNMVALDPIADGASIDARGRSLPFQPGKPAPLRTEQFNIAPVMAPGELDSLVEELVRDFSQHPANDPERVRRYSECLVDFAKDWREVWLEHGPGETGRARYQALVDKVYAQLHPDRRALLTSSNQVGVNPIIVQRILRAVLPT